MKKFGIIFAIALCAALSLSGFAWRTSTGLNQPDYKIYYVGGLNGANDANSTALFKTNGIDAKIAGELLRIANEVGLNGIRTAEDFSAYAFQGASTWQSGAVYLRLFDKLTAASNVSIDARNFTGDDFGSRLWKAVYMRDGVLTLMMAEPYRNSTFEDTDGYVNSGARTDMLADFAQVISKFPTANNAVLSGSRTWQNAQRNSGGWVQDSVVQSYINPSIISTDKVWLPSLYEIWNGADADIVGDGFVEVGEVFHIGEGMSNTNRTGLFRLNGFDRDFKHTGGIRDHAATRSTRINAGLTNIAALVFNSYDTDTGNDYTGVRPCINIDLNALKIARVHAEFEFGSGTANDAGISWVTPNGSIGKKIDIFGVGSDNDTVKLAFYAGSGRKIAKITFGETPIEIADQEQNANWETTGLGDSLYRAYFFDASKLKVYVEFKKLAGDEFTIAMPLVVKCTTEMYTQPQGGDKINMKTIGYVAGGIAALGLVFFVGIAIKRKFTPRD
jgi:hypothetical protein